MAVGQNGPSQVIEAANVGDGQLSLSFTSSVPWASASAGVARPCQRLSAPSCIPVTINFNTASLPRGLASGTITVNDPNAIDAPQSVVVLAQPGGGVPDRIDLFVPPDNRPVTTQFKTNSVLTYQTAQPGGGPSILLLQDGGGSFDFVRSYTLTARAPSGTAARDYPAAIQVTGSSFSGDIKTVPVMLKVTTDPILRMATRVSPYTTVERVSFRIAQGAAPQDEFVRPLNAGLGTLNVTGATVNTASGGNWLTATVDAPSGLLVLRANPEGLGPGSYQGTVRVASNAANGNVELPVDLQVLAVSAPRINYQGVQENALFQPGDPVAPGGWAAVFGEQLTTSAPVRTDTVPLPTSFAGVRVFVNNRAAPILFASAKQVNILIPNDTEPGEAVVRLERDGQASNQVSVKVQPFAPRVLRFGRDLPPSIEGLLDYGIAQIGGTNPVAYAVPPTPGLVTRAVRRGEILTLYGFGLGRTNPLVPDGALPPSSEPLARVTPAPRVHFGGSGIGGTAAIVDADFIGLIPIGLYQINVRVPSNTPVDDQGTTTVFLSDGVNVSNRVRILVQ
jgi:uncharacterized protein (TIGR03437 family)